MSNIHTHVYGRNDSKGKSAAEEGYIAMGIHAKGSASAEGRVVLSVSLALLFVRIAELQIFRVDKTQAVGIDFPKGWPPPQTDDASLLPAYTKGATYFARCAQKLPRAV